MSRVDVAVSFSGSRFPRVSGDEPPELEGCYYMNVFSPRERG